jgi:exonuclease SbcC
MGKTTKYRVERSYKFDKKRENATSSAKLWEVTEEGEICISEGSSKVNKKLEEEIIGLEQKEILRCIALPQGAFADFLNLTRSQRLAFIGKLFGLEKYGKPLANKVNLKLRALNESEKVELGKLSAYAEYTDESEIK